MVAQSRAARRYLAAAVRAGHFVLHSLALVSGELAPGLPAAAAVRSDGAFEASALATYTRHSEGDWGGEGAAARYTLVLLRAAGSACGGERALLKLSSSRPVHGDVEHGGGGTEHWCGGRPFFHTYAIVSTDPWFRGVGLSVVTCPLPADLRSGLAGFRADGRAACAGPAAAAGTEAEALRTTLACTGLLPRDLAERLGLHAEAPAWLQLSLAAPCEGAASGPAAAPEAEPRPFGLETWGGPVSRRRWLVAFALEALRRAPEYGLAPGPSGELSLGALLRRFPSLSAACYNSWRNFALEAEKDPTKALVVAFARADATVRCRPARERLQAFVEAYASRLPAGSRVPLSELRDNGHVRSLLCGQELPEGPLLECLRPSPLFDVVPGADALTLRPMPERVRLGVERLLAAPDALTEKRLLGGRGSLPLSWLVGQYTELLTGQRAAPPLPEVAGALRRSALLEVDESTYLVRLRERPAPAPGPRPGRGDETGYRRFFEGAGRRRFSGKEVSALQRLLDFYFHPFNLQYNRLLLHSAEEESTQGGYWCWRLRRLAGELKRIGLLLQGMPLRTRHAFLASAFRQDLEHVRLVSRLSDEEPLLQLRYRADFRMPMLAPRAPAWLREHFLALSERMPAVPPSAAVVLSYALDCELGPGAGHAVRLERERWQRQILRQLRSHCADVVCVQRCQARLAAPASGPAALSLEPDDSLLAMLARELEREGFEWCAAPARAPGAGRGPVGAANAVFWRRARWLAGPWRAGEAGALRVALRPQRGAAWQLSLGCLACPAEALREQLRGLGGLPPPAVLCGSFGAGPAGVGAALRGEGTGGYRSPHADVLGQELPWTAVAGRGALAPEVELRSTDGIWLHGGPASLEPLAVLAGHSRGPWRDAEGLVCHRAMPTDHLPLLVAIEHTPPGGSNALCLGNGPLTL